MSILLRGMEMPDYGYVCLKVFANGDVVMTKEHRGALVITGIHDKVGTAVPVLPHGRLLKVLKTERECVSRDCNRDCGKCDLSLEQDEVLSAYDTLIALFADQAEDGEK